MKDNPTVVFTKPRHVVLEKRAKPIPGDDQVLIRTERSLVSTGTELTILRAEYAPDSSWSWASRFPRTSGYSNVGTVIDIGSKVDRSWIGRRVATRAKHAAYVTSRVPVEGEMFDPHRILMTAQVDGSVSKEEAAFFALALIALNGVRRAGIEMGHSVVIYGLGLIGQLTARFCRLAGAGLVLGVDIHEPRLDRLPKEKGYHGIDPTNGSVREQLEILNRNRLADVVVECTGNQDLIPAELSLVRPQGKFLLFSSPSGPTTMDFNDLCLRDSLTIIGCHEDSHPLRSTPDNLWDRLRNAEYFFDLVANGRMDVSSLITHRIPYHEAPKAYEMLLEDRSHSLGVLFEWSP